MLLINVLIRTWITWRRNGQAHHQIVLRTSDAIENLQSKSTNQHRAIEAARLIYEFRWRDETTRYKKLLLENDNLVEMAAHGWFEWWGTAIRGFGTLSIFPVAQKYSIFWNSCVLLRWNMIETKLFELIFCDYIIFLVYDLLIHF